MSRQPVHATAVARHTRSGWRAVLLTGASGAGKSDLALRLIGSGWRLVGDDYVHVFASGEALYAAPTERIAGRIEVRGVGIVSRPVVAPVRVVLAVALAQEPPERLPEPEFRTFDGVSLPLLRLDPRETSAGEKVAAALAAL
ncbi:HPr kinase/phosphorylase [Brevundimonas kwangchunensis]|uniref:HPr kinase/phosphorylase n=1 Tax=Brevundimonas kwangchunensis TaxID=322163 RepID=A0ABN1GJR9_9CAUL